MSIEVKGVQRLTGQLQKLKTKYGSKSSYTVLVGYSAPHAVRVHENVEMKLAGIPRPSGVGVYWGRPRRPGRSKFLESAQRDRKVRSEMRKAIAHTTRNTRSILRGLKSGGIVLRNESQKRVPVEFGDLKKSAFVKVT
jgi:hypothetical protein